MKRIMLSLMTIAVVATLAVGATSSYYSDSVDLTGVTFSTGDANLKISQGCMHLWYDETVSLATFNQVYDGCKFNLNSEPWYPGLQKDNILYLGNFSTSHIALRPTLQLLNYTEDVAGLQDVMQMKIWWNGNGTGTDWHSLRYYKDGTVTLPDIAYPTVQPPSYGNGGVLGLTVQVKMDPTAGNEYQNGTVNFDFHFNGDQVH